MEVTPHMPRMVTVAESDIEKLQKVASRMCIEMQRLHDDRMGLLRLLEHLLSCGSFPAEAEQQAREAIKLARGGK
jgi:hypothetical protein